jgi:hypothetical protein
MDSMNCLLTLPRFILDLKSEVALKHSMFHALNTTCLYSSLSQILCILLGESYLKIIKKTNGNISPR